MPKKNKKPRKSGKSVRSGFGSTELIQLMRNRADIDKLAVVIKGIQEYRQSETQFLTDMMFSVNGLTLALTETKMLRSMIDELKLNDDDTVTVGQLKKLLIPFPLIGTPQILSAKARVRKEYIDSRKPFQPHTYDGIILEAQEWAKKLQMEFPTLQAMFDEGKSLEVIIKELGKEELVEDLSPEEEKVVKDAVQKAADNAELAKAKESQVEEGVPKFLDPTEKDTKPITVPPNVIPPDFDNMTEAEMEAALLAEV